MDKLAHRKRQDPTFRGGLETTLDTAAIVFLSLGCLAAIVLPVLGLIGALLGLGILANSVLIWLLLNALSEIIRLQKKFVGMKYGGKISEAEERITYLCSNCGALLHSEYECDSCGSRIASDETVEPEIELPTRSELDG